MKVDCYNSRDITYKRPFGSVIEDTNVEFSVKLKRNKPYSSIKLVIGIEDSDCYYVEMEWVNTDRNIDTYSCGFVPNQPGLYFYYFEVENATEINYIFKDDDSKGYLTDKKAEPYQLTVPDKSYKTPDWFKGGVLYQVFPDRFFRDGSMLEDQTNGRNFIKEWGKHPKITSQSPYPSHDYFGGNLKGITSKLTYLSTLGVTAIYINPIFYAHSYHRYNTSDYLKIDPLLGNEDDLRTLCSKAKKLGIGIILDGVFSHTGTDSRYFNQDKSYDEDGAYNSKQSKYYSWYDFEEYPNKYRCWWGIEDLPQVNTDNPDFLEFITGENGVIKHWLDCGVKGFRLDVADELTPILIERIRERLKKQDKNNILIGEVWEDASTKISYGVRRQYLEGKELDSVMNYPWRSAIIDYIRTGESKSISETVTSILENYPKETIDCLFNLLSSHDTSRLITSLVGESSGDKDFDWKQNTQIPKEQKEKAINILKIATIINYLLPGVPSIYYGDEIGMEGYEDPFNRKCFDWEGGNLELLEWFKQLGLLRKNEPVLRDGLYSEIYSKDGVFAFKRYNEKEELILAVNMGFNKFKLPLDGKTIFSGGDIENINSDYILNRQSFLLLKNKKS